MWETRILELTAIVDELERKPACTRARTLEIANVMKDDSKVQFYTGFPSKEHLQKFLGLAINYLQYWKGNNTTKSQRKKCGCQRKLSLSEEFIILFYVGYVWGCLRRIRLIGSVYMYLLSHGYLSHR